jgi:arylsulfatase A-like enzyme/Tfp pilus assembly protein PilF
VLAACVLAACARGPGAERVGAGTPVVLISIDTLRADHLPAWGYGAVATPALDRLRADSILVRNAWAPAPLTLPSHVTMLTGLLPPAHGVRANAGFTFASAAHPSLPTLLKARGYATGAAVSSYVLRADAGLAGAFDFYEDGIDPPAGASFSEYQRRGDVTAALAGDWIDAHDGGPFFFFLHLYEPHVPYDPPEPFRSRYGGSYDGEIAAADAIVGRFLDHLRQRALYDRALVVLTSDHGEGLGDHGEDQHSILLYAEALRVPLLVKLPEGRRGGETIEEPAQLADIVPTVAGLLGLATPALPGCSLLDLRAAGERHLYGETLYPRLALGWSELRSLVDGRWHLIQGPSAELYDVSRDPRETRDLAAAEPDVTARLRAALEREHPLVLPSPEAVPAEVAERLAALGYVASRSRATGPLPDPRQGLATLREFQAAVRLAAEGRLAPSEAALRQLLVRNPGFVEARVKLGDVLMDGGRPGDAGDAYAEAAAGPSAPGDVWIALGQARLRQGRLDEAVSAADRGMADSPTRAHELKARIALARGDLAAARREVEAARSRARPLPSTLVLSAEVRTRAGDLTGALAETDEAEKIARATAIDAVPGLEFQRADAQARAGRIGEAEAAYRREIARFPRDLRAWANLAVLLHLQHRGGDRDRLMDEMAAANPGPAAVDVAIKTYEALGERSRAAAWRRRVAKGSG